MSTTVYPLLTHAVACTYVEMLRQEQTSDPPASKAYVQLRNGMMSYMYYCHPSQWSVSIYLCFIFPANQTHELVHTIAMKVWRAERVFRAAPTRREHDKVG